MPLSLIQINQSFLAFPLSTLYLWLQYFYFTQNLHPLFQVSECDFLKKRLYHPGQFSHWLEHWPSDQKVVDSIPVKGMNLCCRLNLQSPSQGACGRQPIDVSLSHGSFFLPTPPSPPLFLNTKQTNKQIFYHLASSPCSSLLWLLISLNI